MMDFLIIYGIRKNTIERLLENPSIAFDIESNKEEVIKIILYLKTLGIEVIDDLILFNPDIFLKTKEEIVELFSKFDKQDIVEKINEDSNNIELLFN